MRPADAESARGSAVRQLLLFGALTFLIAGVVSLPITPWVHLSWWKVFRRCVSVSALISLCFFLRVVHHQPPSWIGLTAWGAGKPRLARGLGLALAAVAALFGTYVLTGVWEVRINPDHARVLRVVFLSIPAMILVGFLEESIFRGYLLRRLLRVGRPTAIHFTSLLYALIHIRSAWQWPYSMMEVLGLYLLGWLLAFTVLRAGDLYPAIGLHAGLAYGARVNKLLVELPNPDLTWLAGTSRLINGVGSMVVIGVLFALIARWRFQSSQGGNR